MCAIGETALGIAGFVMDGIIAVDAGKWYNARLHAVDAHGNKIPGIEFEQPVHNDGRPNVLNEATQHPQSNSLHPESHSYHDTAGQKHDYGRVIKKIHKTN